MDKLFLIDAYALIYRSYYAFINNPRINSKGQNTSAIFGFCNTINEIINKEHPTHIAVAFDLGKTFRHEEFTEYKAQREATPEDISLSVPIIKSFLKAMNIPIFEVEGYEADDVIGTIATKASKNGIHTFMFTPDKDYGQLVNSLTYIYKPKYGGGYEIIDEEGIKNKYNIESTKQVIDILALMGDSADNFPGCPGVGEKTASKLIKQFGSIDNMLNNVQDIKGKLRTKVEASIEDIKLSKFLATIVTDAPIKLDMEIMKVKDANIEELTKLFRNLEFNSLLKKFINKQENISKNSNQQLSIFSEKASSCQESFNFDNYRAISTTSHKYKLIENKEDARKLCDFLLTKQYLCLDTETTSVNAIDAELVGLSFAVDEHEAFYIPISKNYEEALDWVNIFKPLYEKESILKIGQNIKYDYKVLSKYNTYIKGNIFDTMIAHYLIQPEANHNMDYMAETLLKYKTIHIEELIGEKGKKQLNMRDLSPKDIYEYACEDADITLQLKNILEPKLKEVNEEKLFWNIEMPLIPILATMELNGVRLDTEALKDISNNLNKRLKQIEKNIYLLAGEEFNISSPKQVGDILFGKLQIASKPKKTKTGQYITSEEVLLSHKNKHPIIEDILNYRGLKKLLSTYVDSLPKLINEKTQHIHTSFNQALTATGRLSSSDPNLQNIPIRTNDGKEIRRAFLPEPNSLFLSADYSQIELRIMAHLSKDENMIEAFNNNLDIHRATAAKIWHEPIENVTDTQRKKAKQANFGIIYGITTYGLAQRMNISNKEAKELIEDYFKTFPKVKEYMENAKQKARERGYAETIFLRRRYLNDINSRNATVRGFAERNAINAPIQGSEADIIKIAMIKIYNRFKELNLKAKMILQVHDELDFSVPKEEKEIVENIVKREMENAYKLSIPLTVDLGWGDNWLEAH